MDLLKNNNPDYVIGNTISGFNSKTNEMWIFDKKGKIIAADSMDEIGTLIDMQAEACTTCHSNKEPLKRLSTSDMARTFNLENGDRVLRPVYMLLPLLEELLGGALQAAVWGLLLQTPVVILAADRDGRL